MVAKRVLLFASSIVWVVCLWRSKYAQQLKLKQDLTQDMFRYIFRRIPPPPPTKKYIYQISNAKKLVFCLLRCLLIGLTNINVWPKTAGMISFFITDVRWPFQNAIDRFVINASFFRSSPNGHKLTNSTIWSQRDRLMHFVFTNIVY